MYHETYDKARKRALRYRLDGSRLRINKKRKKRKAHSSYCTIVNKQPRLDDANYLHRNELEADGCLLACLLLR